MAVAQLITGVGTRRVVAALLLALAGESYASDEEPQMLYLLLPGTYAVIGQEPDGGAAYTGSAEIKYADGALNLVKKVGSETIEARGRVETALAGEAEVVRFDWPRHRATCLNRVDLDNYSRLTCYWTVEGSSHKRPGLEAYFPTAAWP